MRCARTLESVSATPDVSVSPLRAKVEHASFPAMQQLSRLPLLALTGIALALIVVGGILGGVLGAILVALVALFVAWTTYLAWPRLDRSLRLMRVASCFLLVALALINGLSHAVLF